MQTYLISVIVPVYNGEKYIKKCINSILNQTYSNFELIIINDGSVDKTADEVKCIDDKRIRLFNKNNTGVSDTRNYGISLSKGDYLIFIDADDEIESTLFEKMIKIVNEHHVDIIRYNGFVQNKNGKYDSIVFPVEDGLILSSKEHQNQIINIINKPYNSIRCYSPLLFMKNENIINFRKELVYLEDKMFYLENMLNNKKIIFINDELYYYNYNETSKTKNINKFANNIDDLIIAQNTIKKYLSNNYDKLVDSSTIALIIHRIKYLASITKLFQFKKIMKQFLNKDNIIYYLNIDPDGVSKTVYYSFKLLKENRITIFYLTCLIKRIIK